jgi:hypothetical protein
MLGDRLPGPNISPENSQLTTSNLVNLVEAAVLLRETEAKPSYMLEDVRSLSWSTRMASARTPLGAALPAGHPRRAITIINSRSLRQIGNRQNPLCPPARELLLAHYGQRTDASTTSTSPRDSAT